MDSDRASALELLRGLPTSRDVLRPTEPRLSLSLLYKGWTWEHYGKLNLTFFTPSTKKSRRVFIGGLSRCLGQNWGSGGPLVWLADHLTWPGGQPLWQHQLSHIAYPSCQLKLTHVEDGFWKDAKPWPVVHPLARLAPSFVPRRLLVSYCLWLSYFGYNEDMYGFWSIWYFSAIRCSLSIVLVSNEHLSSISWMKCRYVGVKYMHFMTANTLHT
jgi:hypothetical protein